MASPAPDSIRAAIGLIGSSLLGLANALITTLPTVREIHEKLDTIVTAQSEIEEFFMALTQAQQAAVNDLSGSINTLASNLQSVLASAQDVALQLQEMTAEEGREQAERQRLQALLDQIDSDVVGALSPLTQQINTMNQSLQTPPEQGGGPLTPGDAPAA